MATVGSIYPNLLDYSKSVGADGRVVDVIEMLEQYSNVIADAPVETCNQGREHLTSYRTSLPGGAWTALYEPVVPSKSTRAQVTDTVGTYEQWSEVAKNLVDKQKDGAAFMLQEADAQMQAMALEDTDTLFYGNSAANPKEPLGLAPRFGKVKAGSVKGEIEHQVVDAGGTSANDNTSIWFIGWGPSTVTRIVPEGANAGIQRGDMMTDRFQDAATGGLYEVYREHYMMDTGVSVRDHRYISRVANVDAATVRSGTVDVVDHMITGYYRLQQRKIPRGRLVIYCNTEVKEGLHRLALDKGQNQIQVGENDGQEIVTFLGIPIHEEEALLNTEARVIA